MTGHDSRSHTEAALTPGAIGPAVREERRSRALFGSLAGSSNRGSVFPERARDCAHAGLTGAVRTMRRRGIGRTHCRQNHRLAKVEGDE